MRQKQRIDREMRSSKNSTLAGKRKRGIMIGGNSIGTGFCIIYDRVII